MEANEIVLSPDPRLRQECAVIEEITPAIEALAEKMKKMMFDNGGCGLAAPQIGELIQLVTIDCDYSDKNDYDPYVLINPVIVEQSDHLVPYSEGCLSIPGISCEIERPDHVVVEAYDLDANLIRYEASGDLFCVCLQHEIDHLHGNTMFERLKPMQRIKAVKEYQDALARFEQCGIVPRDEMQRIGGVGQAARASGLARDIRTSHPWGVFAGALRHESIVKTHGDVMARLMVRCREVLQSAEYIDRLLDLHGQECGNAGHPCPDYAAPLAPSSLAFGLVEGWRGETCHVLLTDAEGRIAAARIKDPSLHNWLALALAVRGEGISDFPICNKSFNLSYCGHDL